MRVFGIRSVSEKKTEVKTDGYKKITVKSFGVKYDSDRLIKNGIGIKEEKRFGISDVSAVYSDEDVEIFFINGYLCNEFGNKLVRERFMSMPYILSVEKDGKKVNAAILKGAGYFFGESYGRILAPKGDNYLFYDGKIFTFSKNKILFCTLSESVKNGYIVLPVSLGEIAGIIKNGEGLYAVCTKGVVEIANDKKSGFSVDVKLFYDLPVVKNSVKATSFGAAFLCDGKLFYYKDGKVIKEESLLDNGEFSFTGATDFKDGKYIVSVSDEEGEYFFIKDFGTGEDTLLKKGGLELIGNGRFSDVEHGLIYGIKDSNDLPCSWESKPMVFDKEKTVFNIKLYSKTSAVMKVKGDFGESTFNIKAGNNIFRTNLRSKKFVFSFDFLSDGFSIGEQIISLRD